MSEATTDRELLELAAKAFWADDECTFWFDASEGDGGSIVYIHADNQDHNGEDRELVWNSLEYCCNAFELAVKLGLAVIPYPIYSQPKHSVIVKRYEDSLAVYRGEIKQIEVVEVYRDDPAAATRRAITRAAAEIGRAMK